MGFLRQVKEVMVFHEDLLLGELKGKGSMATWGDFKEEYQVAVFMAGVEEVHNIPEVVAFLALQAIQAAVVFQEEDFRDLGEAAFLEVVASLVIQAIQAAVVFQVEEDFRDLGEVAFLVVVASQALQVVIQVLHMQVFLHGWEGSWHNRSR